LSLDYILIIATAVLITLGMLMVYSASSLPAAMMGESSDFFVRRQILWIFLGVVACAIILLLGYRLLKRWSVLMILGTLGMLLVVALVAETTLGANRSMFGGSVRPSELAKLVIIIYVAVWLDAKREVLNNFTFGLIPLIVILGFTAAMVFIQPDISAALTILILGGLMFFLAGGEWRQIVLVIALSLVVGWLAVNLYPTGKVRVQEFVDGLQDITKTSSHIRYSIQAIISGGLVGAGVGQGSIKSIGLPVPHTDSIFAVLAEETGLFGITLLMAGYLVIGWRGLTIARNAADSFGRLLAAGITFWILLEAFINVGVMINLLPNAGNALPFISYGGSHIFINMIGIGFLLSVSHGGQKQQMEGENTFGSVVDLRWRDRRRRVPRSGRPSSTL